MGLWTGRRRCHAEIEEADNLQPADVLLVAVEEVVVRPGEPWSTDQPYPLTIDPAEVF